MNWTVGFGVKRFVFFGLRFFGFLGFGAVRVKEQLGACPETPKHLNSGISLKL